MKCFICEKEAVAICKYCGRAICKEHTKEGPLVVHGIGIGGVGAHREWLEIRGAVWCGICKIKGHGGMTEADKFFTTQKE